MSGIVHFVPDAEDGNGWMIAVFEDRFSPVGIVESDIFLFSLTVIFIGKTDFRVDEQTEFISGADKIFGRNGTVKPHQVESVFFAWFI